MGHPETLNSTLAARLSSSPTFCAQWFVDRNVVATRPISSTKSSLPPYQFIKPITHARHPTIHQSRGSARRLDTGPKLSWQARVTKLFPERRPRDPCVVGELVLRPWLQPWLHPAQKDAGVGVVPVSDVYGSVLHMCVGSTVNMTSLPTTTTEGYFHLCIDSFLEVIYQAHHKTIDFTAFEGRRRLCRRK